MVHLYSASVFLGLIMGVPGFTVRLPESKGSHGHYRNGYHYQHTFNHYTLLYIC